MSVSILLRQLLMQKLLMASLTSDESYKMMMEYKIVSLIYTNIRHCNKENHKGCFTSFAPLARNGAKPQRAFGIWQVLYNTAITACLYVQQGVPNLNSFLCIAHFSCLCHQLFLYYISEVRTMHLLSAHSRPPSGSGYRTTTFNQEYNWGLQFVSVVSILRRDRRSGVPRNHFQTRKYNKLTLCTYYISEWRKLRHNVAPNAAGIRAINVARVGAAKQMCFVDLTFVGCQGNIIHWYLDISAILLRLVHEISLYLFVLQLQGKAILYFHRFPVLL